MLDINEQKYLPKDHTEQLFSIISQVCIYVVFSLPFKGMADHSTQNPRSLWL